MNILYQGFCRVFQFCFRAVMPILPYREPEILDSVLEIKDVLIKKKISSVLIVTDGFLHHSGALSKLEKSLSEAEIEYAVYDGAQSNPTVHNVEEAVKMYHRHHAQGLIAFGGGSPMDCAKAAGARIVFPNKSVNQMKGLLRVWKKLPLLIAVPTTAGTGSEVTIAAVITDSEKKYKYTMNNFTMIPSYAVLDAEVTVTLPAALTATTGMDALVHAVEAYIGQSTTRQTRAFALETVQLVFENIEKAYHDGTNIEARKNMLKAAYMAGIAFSKSYVGYIHAVAHSLGGQYNIPHGLANSVLMPYVLDEYGSSVEKKLKKLGISARICTESDSDHDGAQKMIQAIRDLNQRMGIPETLPGILKQDIPVMARHAAKEANPLYPVPKLMSARELEHFYLKVMSGRESNEY